ncbi:MAG: stage III sporulation protein AF [Bacillota bacterium]|nr:stage III sporulation protein AF [Bacillota bacterium]
MIDFLRGWTVNIVTLVIFIVLLEILVPSGKMKKFINLVSGFLIMITLITPFLKFINKDVDLKDLEFTESVQINQKDIEQKSKLLSKNQSNQVIEVYRQKIIGQLETYLKKEENIEDVKADISVDEDSGSGKYGEISRVYINLKIKGDKKGIDKVKSIEKIQIKSNGEIKVGNNQNMNINDEQEQKTKKTEDNVDSKLKNRLENKINELLGVSKENIIITQQYE